MTIYSKPLWGVNFVKLEKQKAAIERQRREGRSPTAQVDEHFARLEQSSTLEALVNTGSEEETVAFLKNMPEDLISPVSLDFSLLCAAQRGVRSVIEGLLVSGADVNYNGSLYYNGCTPLTMAVSEGHVEMASLLLTNDADVNHWHPATHETVLMLALRSPNCVQMVDVLLSWEPNVNEVNVYGQSALVLALIKQEAAVVTMLVADGAKLDSPLWDGSTPSQLAREHGMEDAVNAGLQAIMPCPASPVSDSSDNPVAAASYDAAIPSPPLEAEQNVAALLSPAIAQDQGNNVMQAKAPSAMQAEAQSLMQAKAPSAMQAGAQSLTQAKAPSTMQAEAQSLTQAKAPSAMQAEAQSLTQAKALSAMQAEAQSLTQAKAPSAMQAEAQSLGQAKAPSAMQAEAQSLAQAKAPSAMQAEAQSLAQAKAPSAMQAENPCHEEYSPMEVEDCNSLDESMEVDQDLSMEIDDLITMFCR